MYPLHRAIYEVNERITGRKARGLQMEEIGCKCQTFFISLLSGRRKQTSDMFFSLLYTNLTPVLLPGKSHGWRSLVGCSPGCCEESDTTERFHFHFSLSCIGERNGNPLQCSRLENPRTGKPGGLPSMGLHRVGHDWSDLAAYKFKKEVPLKILCCHNDTWFTWS